MGSFCFGMTNLDPLRCSPPSPLVASYCDRFFSLFSLELPHFFYILNARVWYNGNDSNNDNDKVMYIIGTHIHTYCGVLAILSSLQIHLSTMPIRSHTPLESRISNLNTKHKLPW